MKPNSVFVNKTQAQVIRETQELDGIPVIPELDIPVIPQGQIGVVVIDD